MIESSSDEDESGLQDEKQSGSVLDMEDLGNIMNRVNQRKVLKKALLVVYGCLFSGHFHKYIVLCMFQWIGFKLPP